ncbi:MAG: hypothetical protein HOK52_11195 [Candidatus Marinimicrobia bacterium]|jgi:hypothetical protein|nr:hypothetical protein [Candidatus Neomarinimicrobiota bacterium]
MSSYNKLQIECIICFNKINKTKNLRTCTTCGGNYHKQCLKYWWKKSPDYKNICPTCQTESIYVQRKYWCCVF